ncbi:hypothetical protein BGZ83_003525 [Gryganskiella cystojenkinii]|nr:hypothetical protein BGZ83_003525 [Gryganskiella cystojenkinii]
MLSLIRTTGTATLRRTRLPTSRLRASSNIHHSCRSLSSAPASAPAPAASEPAAAPSKDSPSSDPIDPVKETVDTTSGSSSNTARASTPLSKRRLRTARGSGRGGIGKSSQSAADPTSKVYVPSIPDSFLATNYHHWTNIPHYLSAFPYHVPNGILAEVVNTMASSLLAPHPPQTFIQKMPARHNNLILSSPSEGSSQLLETITMAAANEIDADVITVDVQDLMELTSDMFNGKGTGNPWPVDHLSRGFNPFVSAPLPIGILDTDDDDEDFEDDDDDMDDSDDQESYRGATVFVDSRAFAKVRPARHGMAQNSTNTLKEKFEKFWTALLLAEPKSASAASPSSPEPTGNSSISTTSSKRGKSSPKVLYLKDIADIIHTSLGAQLIPSLSSAVLTLRRAGHNIMIVAGHSPSLLTALQPDVDESSTAVKSDWTSSSSGGVSLDSDVSSVPIITILQKLKSPADHGGHQSRHSGTSSLSSLLYDNFPGPTQTFHHISIPPILTMFTARMAFDSTDPNFHQFALENARLLQRDKAIRIKEINCRNLDAVLKFRGGVLDSTETCADVFGSLEGIQTEIWGFPKVYKIISTALGSLYLSQMKEQKKNGSMDMNVAIPLSKERVERTMQTLEANLVLRKVIVKYDPRAPKKSARPLVNVDDCNAYEKRLFQSIVDPEKIKTTFENVITPPETVNALQTMITLPLIRPQLFSYGLLQNEFLSGLLLFGPPGTGKTLLAKAVAKSSGARMLEIKASDIFDMYVGEGEKNVSAVFSLARKLSPCVIYLDEVDSIFRARGSSGSGGGNSSQREILNQFMVEWDGLRSSGQNNGIVVMASTNRPFDLDDAVLRRLPRRIMVDLPSEEAREKILNVYLSQEKLEDGFDLKDLVRKTKFFSGSDLKNLCVAAALASVRESVEKEVMALTSGSMNVAVGDSPSMSATTAAGDKVLDLSPLLDQYKKEAIETIAAREADPSLIFDQTMTPTSTSSPTRVISRKHFEKALTQITPSCSENMESLTELKKWDGLYGDAGKGRRKGSKSLGFQ